MDQKHATAQQRQIKGLLNRLSDMNFCSTIASFEELYLQHHGQNLTSNISEQIIKALIETPNVLDRFILQYSTLVVALSSIETIDAEFGIYFLAALVDRLKRFSNVKATCVTFSKMLAFLYVLRLVPESLIVEVCESLLCPDPFINMEDGIKVEVVLVLIKGCDWLS